MSCWSKIQNQNNKTGNKGQMKILEVMQKTEDKPEKPQGTNQ